MRVTVYSTKPYDRHFLDRGKDIGLELRYCEARLSSDTVSLAAGADAICAFVNDDLSRPMLEQLAGLGVKLIALRCAGFNNVDLVAAQALGILRPRVALLNIGTEDVKGNQQVKLAASLLQQAQGLNYIGFVEGDGLYRGEADVVVCDGFVGNILLKSSEGLVSMISERIEALFNEGFVSRLAGAVALPLLKRLRGELAPARHNGASFLGLQGIVVKSHGAASSEGFQSAIRRAVIEVRENLPQRLHGRLEDLLL